MKKFTFIVLIFVLLSAAIIPVSAENAPSRKEEVVYGLLNTDGSVKRLHVVNIFAGGAITDYGEYSEIRNMTTSEKLNKDGDRITINTSADKFYYQGTLENRELPWKIAIKYFLDGKEIPGKELGGKSGALKIHILVKQNKKENDTFFKNYALQITVSLDNGICSDIKTENATIADTGSKKQLTYTVLPGSGADIAVTANVSNFKMEPISINGIRLALDIDIDSTEFTNQIASLADAIRELDGGAGELLDGVKELSDGMQQYADGLKAFKEGLAQFSAGSAELNAGASALKYGLSELTKQNDLLLEGALAIRQATFDSVNAQLAGMSLGIPVLTPENYSAILSAIPALADVKRQLDGVVEFTQGLENYLNGVSELSAGASSLAAGISEFKNNLLALASTANELYTAGAELNEAVKALRDGLEEYKSGTNRLSGGISGMGPEIEKKINEILSLISGGDGKTISFVSDKNTDVTSVMFVLKTDPINPPEVSEPARPEPVKLNFWQRLLKLFGLYKG